MTIRPDQYIRWVQLSLRRQLGVKLKASGEDSPAYRDAVKRFQREQGILPNGKVGVNTQNALIKANTRDQNYVRWMQRALNKVGAGVLTISGSFDKATRDAVLSFQSFNGGLEDDGWVGVKTELILIQQSGLLPPDRPGGYPETPKPKPSEPTDVTDAQLNNKLKNLSEWLDEFGLESNSTEQCLVTKLLKDTTDDAVYYPLDYISSTHRGKNDIFDFDRPARMRLKAFIKRRWARGVPVTPEILNGEVEQIVRDLVTGVRSLEFIDCYDRRTRPLRRFIHEQSKRSNSLYNCPNIRSIIENLKKDKWSYDYGHCAG